LRRRGQKGEPDTELGEDRKVKAPLKRVGDQWDPKGGEKKVWGGWL